MTNPIMRHDNDYDGTLYRVLIPRDSLHRQTYGLLLNHNGLQVEFT
jgi:hypothetical protein